MISSSRRGASALLLADPVDEVEDVLKVVVKGVAADVADVHNALDADLVQRSFVEQFDKRRLDGILGVIVRHPAPPFSETESDSIVPQNREKCKRIYGKKY